MKILSKVIFPKLTLSNFLGHEVSAVDIIAGESGISILLTKFEGKYKTKTVFCGSIETLDNATSQLTKWLIQNNADMATVKYYLQEHYVDTYTDVHSNEMNRYKLICKTEDGETNIFYFLEFTDVATFASFLDRNGWTSNGVAKVFTETEIEAIYSEGNGLQAV
ncbi:hypothetical protein [Vibrio splendidus]|uniref:hypothetical protein n=1 Tax=Vibrio splendidus TaxID=29497 RepID=UPI003D097694